MMLVTHEHFSAKVWCAKGISKVCLLFRLCFHKHRTVLETEGRDNYKDAIYDCVAKHLKMIFLKLNPEFCANSTFAKLDHFVDEGAPCLHEHDIFHTDVKVALAALRWLREAFF
ncbi:uncharacterized protein LOC120844933 isoform X1 [Ixodes scapularis]|uniref:uncharacterized protein LOC120844933 isoform X1 n=1 Tax=Ixodes scapularis TaxID=6945 RepID=UPI001A9F3169|nr:uncharacterized protein LOC120844933 isoform X1 [Ixodes scapularis]